jgi:hypothetical protein
VDSRGHFFYIIEMLTRLKKVALPVLIALSALSVSGSAAFYSVYGLSKLFAGAQLQVIIMAGSLEVSKLVIASLLYQYWDSLNKILRTYLTVAAFVLVLITSMGIYGFLSAAYQETYSAYTVSEKRIEFLEQKQAFFSEDVSRYDTELERISATINELSKARATQIQVRDTSSATGLRTTVSTAELRLAQDRIASEEVNRKEVQAKRTVAADSLQSIQIQILEMESNSEVAAELGPLKYISEVTGWEMSRIVNILLLVIIFVFDPLAISLVIAANFAFAQLRPDETLYGELLHKDGTIEVPKEKELPYEEEEEVDDAVKKSNPRLKRLGKKFKNLFRKNS